MTNENKTEGLGVAGAAALVGRNIGSGVIGNSSHECLLDRIENDFTYHPPKPGQPEKYHALREKGKELAKVIAVLCPAGREQSTALTKIEEAVMWANAGIARRCQ